MKFFLLVLPIYLTQLAIVGINFFDTTMSGQAGSEQLAGVAIAVSLWLPVSTGLSGILMAVTPMVAQAMGAKEEDKVGNIVWQGIYVAFAVAILVIGLGSLIAPFILEQMNLEPEVFRVASGYLKALAFGIIPFFLYTVLRCFIDALGYPRVTMIITLTALPISIALNYLLIFGHFGFPQLGGIGAGVASAFTHWVTLLAAIFIIRKSAIFSQFFNGIPKLSLPMWKEILKLGVPIGLAIFFETSIFAVVTLMMSNFTTETIAAHQAAMNFSSILYMSPLSISMAMTIVVGREVGANRKDQAKRYTSLGLTTALIIAFLSGLFIVIFRQQVASLYTQDPHVMELIQYFLIYALFFQVSDAIASPVQGALRGYKDVNATLIMTLIAYWVIGLPIGFILANFTHLGASGYWIGLITGLAVAAVALIIRLLRIQRMPL